MLVLWIGFAHCCSRAEIRTRATAATDPALPIWPGLTAGAFRASSGVLSTSHEWGFSFLVNSAIKVTQFGFYDPTPTDPLSQNHPIGLWDDSGTLLAEATVLTTSPVVNSFRYVPISPITLVPSGTGEYHIGAIFVGSRRQICFWQ
jgi:hypothetical protein